MRTWIFVALFFGTANCYGQSSYFAPDNWTYNQSFVYNGELVTRVGYWSGDYRRAGNDGWVVVSESYISGAPIYPGADEDGDGLGSLEEMLPLQAGTHPLVADTDGDGYDDGQEIADGTDPNDANDFYVPPGTIERPFTLAESMEIGVDGASLAAIGGAALAVVFAASASVFFAFTIARRSLDWFRKGLAG